MAEAGGRRSLEQEIDDLKRSLDKYTRRGEHAGAQATSDLTKAIHDLADHVVALNSRIEKIEDSQEEWTTKGWEPPPGSDIPPGQDD